MTEWTHYLTRPMSLFESSLWHEWYASPYSTVTLGATMPDVLFVEYPKGNARHFRKPTQLNNFLSSIKKITLAEPQKMEMILTNGLTLLEEAKKCITSPGRIKNLEESVDFLTRLGLQTANIPRVALNTVEENNLHIPKLIELAEKIRKQTVYPEFTKKVVVPLAINILKKEDVKNPRQKIHLLTYKELQGKQFTELDQRTLERKEEKLFIYKNNNGVEKVNFSHENQKTLAKLTSISLDKTPIIKGSVAYRGKATGRARIILNNKAKNFSSGDVLVSISSSPELMPYILKCSAIITDEGGLGCHAAVISRELKKPCIIGTKIATQVLKDGDLVEVDANKGTIEIIKQAE